jgi:hypothetical protein
MTHAHARLIILSRSSLADPMMRLWKFHTLACPPPQLRAANGASPVARFPTNTPAPGFEKRGKASRAVFDFAV